MATNNANSDIEILVGVQGGDDINDGSGKLIANTLKEIARKISTGNLIKVKIDGDPIATKKAFQKTLNQADLKIHNVSFGNNIANALQNQLNQYKTSLAISDVSFGNDIAKTLQDQLSQIKLSVNVDANVDSGSSSGEGSAKPQKRRGGRGGSGGGGSRRGADWRTRNERSAKNQRIALESIRKQSVYNIQNVKELTQKLQKAEGALQKLSKLDVEPDEGLLSDIKTFVADFRAAVKEYNKLKDAEINSPVSGRTMEARLSKLKEIRKSVNLDISQDDPENVQDFKSTVATTIASRERTIERVISGDSSVSAENIDASIKDLVDFISKFNAEQQRTIELQEKIQTNQSRIADAISDTVRVGKGFGSLPEDISLAPDKNIEAAIGDIYKLNTELKKLSYVRDAQDGDGVFARVRGDDIGLQNIEEFYNELIAKRIEYISRTEELTGREEADRKRYLKLLHDYVAAFLR